MKAAALAAMVLAAALVGCDRPAAPPKQAAPAPTAAAAALPLSFAQNTADAEVKLTLPPALAKHPALHRTLYDRETEALKAFAATAGADRAEFGADMPPYAMEVTWRVAAETPRLLSLVREGYEFSGGAHPNGGSTTLLFDKAAGREIERAALFPDEAAHPRLERALCDSLRRVKAERGGVPLDGDVWTCPKWNDSQAALTPGPGGRASGLTFLFSPYEVGPYAEGSFEVSLAASVFLADVAPAYRDQFAAG